MSAVLTDGPARRLVRRCVTGQDALLASPSTLQELVDVLKRPKFGLAEDEVHRVLAAVVATSLVIQPRRRLRVIEADPDDDAFLELAVEGRADMIVSGDRHLLDLGEFEGVPIRRLADALKELDS